MKLGQGLEEGTSPPPARAVLWLFKERGRGLPSGPRPQEGTVVGQCFLKGTVTSTPGEPPPLWHVPESPPPWLALKLTPPSGCLRVTATGSFTRLALPGNVQTTRGASGSDLMPHKTVASKRPPGVRHLLGGGAAGWESTPHSHLNSQPTPAWPTSWESGSALAPRGRPYLPSHIFE